MVWAFPKDEMQLTRKEFLSIIGSSMFGLALANATSASLFDEALQQRHARRIIKEYDAQGLHRTGTAVDRASAFWLASEFRKCGLQAQLEPFALNRLDPLANFLEIGGRYVSLIGQNALSQCRRPLPRRCRFSSRDLITPTPSQNWLWNW